LSVFLSKKQKSAQNLFIKRIARPFDFLRLPDPYDPAKAKKADDAQTINKMKQM
jgi:hypothetical protein